MQNDKGIVNGNLLKAFIKYILPLLFGSLIQQSYSIVDALIVGNFAGKEALAATDAPIAYIRLLINSFVALTAGGSIFISLLYGAGDEIRVKKSVQSLMKFSVISGLIMTVIGILLTPIGIKIMLVPEEISAMSATYLGIYFLGTVFVLIYNMASSVMRAVGDTKQPFIYLIISAILNVVLDLLFVAVIKGGVAGAAIATVLSQVISAVLIVRRLILTKDCYGLDFKRYDDYRNILKPSLKMGLPMAMQSAMFAIANMYMQSGINRFGTDGIAGWTIIGKSDPLMFIVAESVGLTITIFTAQNLGARNIDRIKKTIKIGSITSFSIIILLSFGLFFGANILSSLYTDDMGAKQKALEFARIVAPFYIGYAISEVYCGVSKGLGNTIAPMIVTLISIGVFRILWMSIIYPIFPSATTVIIGYPISWCLCGLTAAIIYYIFIKKKLCK